MSMFTRKSSILITCPREIPPYLKNEILSLGFPVRSEFIAAVETEGTLEDTMKLNLFLRTGHRVLYLLKKFRAANPDELYKKVSEITWEEYIRKDGYLSVSSSVNNPSITDTRFANRKCKDAIVDRFYKKYGQRPDSGPGRDDAVIYLYWENDRCSIYLDTSGAPLPRRGYRKIPFKAPMQETLAAATIIATGWNGEENFINPMCGSGTLAIEAALIALNKAPGLLRDNFGFMHIRGFKKDLWTDLRNGASSEVKESIKGKIIATDIDPRAIEAARKNARMAGVGNLINFGIADYSQTFVPEGSGIVMVNPEYGERMGEIEELKDIYRGIGDYFKKSCQGYRGYIFTGNSNLAKQVGLRTKRKIPFYNSNIECRLLEYDLYEGSKKDKKDTVTVHVKGE
ncbi:MAG: class I SAM-dependent RNA methyltransferase [Thermodesulfobacteriota bacterium]|nr:class I SAM-dependent RNA methyltransferase [Thermodesulfobacteriota bacterium]